MLKRTSYVPSLPWKPIKKIGYGRAWKHYLILSGFSGSFKDNQKRNMRVATDIGGTFTDVVVVDESGIQGWKVLSTPTNPDRAVTETIQALQGIASFSHGTTVATNALLERKGANVAFVTTAGFRDLLYIARQTRPRLYDFDCQRPSPLVPRNLCFEIRERLAPDGTVVVPLEEAELNALVRNVIDAGAEAVAVCLLFSFKNPSHEIRIEDAFAGRGIPVSRSSDIVPEFREFERASTTTINAFVQPTVDCYVKKIRQALRDTGGPGDYYIMKSGGGVATSPEVYPVELLLSGPAGGVAGGLLLCRNMGKNNLVTFDMGGTSADFSAIVDNAAVWTEEGEIDGIPVRVPILDITTVGAGGGSVAWIDKGGALRVGPQSAGSDPGPACYGRNGTLPTVTDANLLVGLLDPRSFLGSQVELNLGKAKSAFETLSQNSGIAMEELVLGVRSVVNANMLRGIRKATVEKGVDVRDSVLLAFGGAGPLHGVDLAKELGIREVLVPPMAGMFSALGILLSDVRIDYGETLLSSWTSATQKAVEDILSRFHVKALSALKRQGLDQRKAEFHQVLDLRYKGQSFHLPVNYEQGGDIAENFRKAFRKRFGYAMAHGHPMEVVTVRLSTTLKRADAQLPPVTTTSPFPPITERNILLASGRQSAQVYMRKHLWKTFEVGGPVIIEDQGCTVFVPPGCTVSMERNGCLRIEVG
jgi:N-methylhydantoinase A